MVGTGSSLQPGGRNTTDIVHTLKAFMIEQSLPLWAGEGWDPSTGGFVERLDREGNADRAAARRVRVQARQIYAFAKAAQLEWYPEGRDIALMTTNCEGPELVISVPPYFASRASQ